MFTHYRKNASSYFMIALTTLAVAFAVSAVYETQSETVKMLRAKVNKNTNLGNIMLKETGVEYSFFYPASYYSTTDKVGNGFITTVRKGWIGKMEIFKMKDFGDRPWGFEPETEDAPDAPKLSEAEKQLNFDSYVPKEQLKAGPAGSQYDVWLYYNVNDLTTKKELHDMVNSLTF